MTKPSLLRRSWPYGYVLAIGLVVLISVRSFRLPLGSSNFSMYFLYIGAVLVSFYFCGIGPGVLSAALSSFAAAYIVLRFAEGASSANIAHFPSFLGLLALLSLLLSRYSITATLELRRRKVSEGILSVATAVAGSLDTREIARRVLAVALRVTGMEAGAVWTADVEQGRAVLLARRGRADLFRDICDISLDSEGLVAQVICSGRPHFGFISDCTRRLNHAITPQCIGARTAAVVPVSAKGKVLGAIALGASKKKRLSREDKSLLSGMAHQLAVALENAALCERSSQDKEFLATVMDQMPMGVLVVDAEQMSVVRANNAAESLLNATFGASNLVGSRLDDLFPGDAHKPLLDWCRQVIAAGDALQEDDYEIVASDGRTVYWSCQVAPFSTHEGRVKSLIVAITDTSERVSIAKRLAEGMAAEIVSQGDPSAQRWGLQAILDSLPDGILILGAPDCRLVMFNRAAADILGRCPSLPLPLEQMCEIYAPHSPSGEPYDPQTLPMVRAVKSGERVTEEEIVVRRPDGSTICLSVTAEPLLGSDNSVVAAMATFHDVTGLRRYAQELEKAYEREHTIAEALQKSLLSAPPERVGRLEIAALYRPALEEAELGGDFYDAFSLSSRKLAVVIADVSGKGLEAAVQLAAVKYNLRNFAHRTRRPSLVLKRTHDALCRDSAIEGFVTLFYGVIDVRTGRMLWASAGHEPPLLRRRDGTIEELWPTGRALCAMPGSVYEDQEVWLCDGDVLLLYTDGLSEARTDSGFVAPQGITEIFRHINVEPVASAVSDLYSAVLPHTAGRLRDDVAIMLLRVTEHKAAVRRERAKETREAPAAWV